ncbi:hypothetical protein PoB_005639500 [Plakobranchus ocellatus]|uniref:Uncharacterized protein n=1 Tax=Plakobranchus ocellatus TaxID=259542 RepID=A0AAV4CAW2_9GAST|nr:hypothetical protein PoB_005639500 [Plakobranchus ocellatus]
MFESDDDDDNDDDNDDDDDDDDGSGRAGDNHRDWIYSPSFHQGCLGREYPPLDIVHVIKLSITSEEKERTVSISTEESIAHSSDSSRTRFPPRPPPTRITDALLLTPHAPRLPPHTPRPELWVASEAGQPHSFLWIACV